MIGRGKARCLEDLTKEELILEIKNTRGRYYLTPELVVSRANIHRLEFLGKQSDAELEKYQELSKQFISLSEKIKAEPDVKRISEMRMELLKVAASMTDSEKKLNDLDKKISQF